MGAAVRIRIEKGLTMATKLDKALKRELEIDGKPYMLTIDPTGGVMPTNGLSRPMSGYGLCRQ